MKDSSAYLSCVVTLAGCITALRLHLKQARGTKGRGVCVSVNERLDPSFSFAVEIPHACDPGNANDELECIWKMESSSVLITL